MTKSNGYKKAKSPWGSKPGDRRAKKATTKANRTAGRQEANAA